MREWLKQIREQKGFTQQNVAEKLLITQQYYNKIENGERQQKMTMELATKLSKIFSISIEYILQKEKIN